MSTPTKKGLRDLVIPVEGTEITCYSVDLEGDEEDVIHGVLTLFGVTHHVQFIKVEDDAKGVQQPTKDPHGRFLDMLKVDDIHFETVQVPGYEGDWVLLIHPGEA